MRSRLLLAVVAGLAVVLLAGGTAWALLGPDGEPREAVPAPIDVPAREEPTGTAPDSPTPSAPGTAPSAPGTAPSAPGPSTSAPGTVPPSPGPTDVVPPPPLTDGDPADDGPDDGGPDDDGPAHDAGDDGADDGGAAVDDAGDD